MVDPTLYKSNNKQKKSDLMLQIKNIITDIFFKETFIEHFLEEVRAVTLSLPPWESLLDR